MSLKAFHVVFITVATLLALLMAAWCLQGYQQTGEPGPLLGAAGSLLGGVALVAYGSWFLRKMGRLA
jgi:hypothetical protein